MAVEPGTFETIVPSRYISFTLPVPAPLFRHLDDYIQSNYLRVAVMDSPRTPSSVSQVAAMLVPKYREDDWIFTTEAGHRQLLFGAPEICRLILVGNAPGDDSCLPKKYRRWEGSNPDKLQKLEESLYPLLIVFFSENAANLGNFAFLRYEDNVLSSVLLEKCIGACVGEILIEDVEVEGHEREFRRRLRFKRMPNLVQTEIRIKPNRCYDDVLGDLCVGEDGFQPDLAVLVHPYLAPMVASLSLKSGYIQECLESGIRPKALCIGVGGGSLLSFLYHELGLEVVGVELDQVVLRVARKYFGLQDDRFIQIFVGDVIEHLKKMAGSTSKSICLSMSAAADDAQTHGCRARLDLSDVVETESCKAKRDVYDDIGTGNCEALIGIFSHKFDILMVDLDSTDGVLGISAPPLEFVQESVLMAARSCLSEYGVLVLNTISSDKLFYETLVTQLGKVFDEVHEIDARNGENFILIALRSPVNHSFNTFENAFLRKLKSLISGEFMDSIIRKI